MRESNCSELTHELEWSVPGVVYKAKGIGWVRYRERIDSRKGQRCY
jgi:hypothetical protein